MTLIVFKGNALHVENGKKMHLKSKEKILFLNQSSRLVFRFAHLRARDYFLAVPTDLVPLALPPPCFLKGRSVFKESRSIFNNNIFQFPFILTNILLFFWWQCGGCMCKSDRFAKKTVAKANSRGLTKSHFFSRLFPVIVPWTITLQLSPNLK